MSAEVVFLTVSLVSGSFEEDIKIKTSVKELLFLRKYIVNILIYRL